MVLTTLSETHENALKYNQNYDVQLKLLKVALQSSSVYHSLLGTEEDLKENTILILRKKIRVGMAPTNAKEYINEYTWNWCCEKATAAAEKF